MCTLQEFKDANDLQHEALKKDIKNISTVNKSLLIIILAIFGLIFVVTFKYLSTVSEYTEKTYKVRLETFEQIQILSSDFDTFKEGLNENVNTNIKVLSDTMSSRWQKTLLFYENEYKTQTQWTQNVYDKEIHPTTKRSISNGIRITNLENKVQ